MSPKKLVLLAVIVALIAVYFAFDPAQHLNLATLKTSQADLAVFHAAHPARAAGAYFLLYVLVTALSLPGAALLTLAGGAVFGLAAGTLIVSFASTLGATLAFLSARFLLRDWVTSRFGRNLRAIDEGIRREGAWYLFSLRLVPIFPFFLINLLFGLTAMKARTFAWVSQVGMLAGTLAYVNAGTQLAKIETLSGILSPAVLASFAVLGLFPLIARRVVAGVNARRVYAGWTRPERFDRNLIVIGGGSAGLVSAYLAAASKAKVTLVEQDKLGGDCLNTGCVPSKALIRSARLLAEIARAPDLGIASATAEFDFAAVMDRVQAVVKRVEPHDSAERYAGLGVEVMAGTARIVSPWEVEIAGRDGNSRRLSTRSIVIATGAGPLVPLIPGLEDTGYLTSDTVWSLRQVPRRLLVLGGGPIGCELGQAFARFGSRVVLVEMGPRLLPREDPEVSELVMRRFRAEGIEVAVNHRAARCLMVNEEKILVTQRGEDEVRLPFDALLVAVGRAGRLRGYGLEELAIAAEHTIEVNEFLQTRFPNIYAAGDVAGPFQFTHTAAHQAWYATVNALIDPLWTFRADYSVIPWATFIEPEVARVGLNEQEATEQAIGYETSVFHFDELDRAIADGTTVGFIKVLTATGSDRILGATIVGEHAADLLTEYVLAMKHGIGLNKILGTIHIYPTLAEANKSVAGVWKKAHAPEKLLAWVARFHAWRRG